MLHKLADLLERGQLPESGSTPQKLLTVPGSTNACLLAYGTSVPSAVAGYAVGGLFIHTDGTTATRIYQNVGTASSCTFSALMNLADAQTVAGALTLAGGVLASGSATYDFSGSTGAFTTSSGTNTLSGTVSIAANKNVGVAGAGTTAVDFSNGTGIFKTTTGAATLGGDTTVAANKALAVTTADKLTVASVIVPQDKTITCYIPTLAGKTIYDIFIADRAYTVTAVKAVCDIAQGGAATATVVKATGTNAPAAGTTPLTQAAFDFNGTPYAVVTGTLTATGADLALAAGDRIGVVLSTALTQGAGLVEVTLKCS